MRSPPLDIKMIQNFRSEKVKQQGGCAVLHYNQRERDCPFLDCLIPLKFVKKCSQSVKSKISFEVLAVKW